MDPRLPEDRNSEVFTQPPHTRPHVETGREARQGPLGRPILYVLIGGLILAAIYLVATQIWSNTEDLPPAGQIEGTTVTPETPVAPAATPETPPAAVAPETPAAITPAPAPEATPAPVEPLAPVTPVPVAP